MRFLLPALICLIVAFPPQPQPGSESWVKITPLNVPCDDTRRGGRATCESADALFFVHGIYGDKETFKNGAFDWPSEIAKTYGASKDVYMVEYQTKLLAWLKKDIAS